MTFDAQAALRRIIEENTQDTRFIIICNYVTKIIDPIQSRCAIMAFHPLEDQAHIERLKFIAAKQEIQVVLRFVPS